jgi:hypothetical protein
MTAKTVLKIMCTEKEEGFSKKIKNRPQTVTIKKLR